MIRYVVLDFEVKDKSNLIEDGVFKKRYTYEPKLNQVIIENILSMKLLDLEKNQVVRITEKDNSIFGRDNYNEFLGISCICLDYRKMGYMVNINRVDKVPNSYMECGYGYEYEYGGSYEIFLLTDYEESKGCYGAKGICKEFIENHKELFKTVPCYYMEVDKLQQVFGLNLYKDNLKAKLLGKVDISFTDSSIILEEERVLVNLRVMFLQECRAQGCKQLEDSIKAQVHNGLSLDDIVCESSCIESKEDLVTCDRTIAIKNEFVDRFFTKSNVYDAYKHYDESIDRLVNKDILLIGLKR